MKKYKIGIVGVGTVGRALIQMVQVQNSVFREKFGLELDIVSVASRTVSKIPDTVSCNKSTDYRSVTENPEVDLVVELVGGTTTAFEIVQSALKNGKTLVTANKALISERGKEIFPFAERAKLEVGFEAAVAGAIPVIRSLRNSLGSNSFETVAGILNGTTNFILTKMETEKLGYLDALRIAQEKGYAEADPSFDVEGIDVAHKISILAGLAFGYSIPFSSISVQGITQITGTDIQNAKELGFRIKLLGLASRKGEKVSVSVFPALLPITHPLANVMEENNGVYYLGSHSGQGMMTGKGAGGDPTASAVLSDILYYCMRREGIAKGVILPERNQYPTAQMKSQDSELSRFYLRFSTVDRPGVLAEVARILGKNEISISSVNQRESVENEPTQVIILTHSAAVGNYRKALAEIDRIQEIILEPTMAIPLLENL
jgi:homoserine dehydrogenase